MIKSVFGSDRHGATWACSPPGLYCRLTVSEQALRQRVIWHGHGRHNAPSQQACIDCSFEFGAVDSPCKPAPPTI